MTWRLPEPTDPDSFQPPPPPFRWKTIDFVVFAVFFLLTVLFLPLGMILILRIFRPDLRVTDLTGVEQVLLQGVMDLMLVGFIFFLIRVVHGLPFKQSINWTHKHQFRIGYLIGLGASLAAGALVISGVFPTSEPTPLEKLINSQGTLYVFVLLGVGIAPGVEEIIFRGFLFRVFEDIKGTNRAIPITAALFAALHLLQLWGNWVGVIWIFFVGYVLSLVRARSNSLVPSFVIHTTYNATLFAFFAVGTVVQHGLNR